MRCAVRLIYSFNIGGTASTMGSESLLVCSDVGQANSGGQVELGYLQKMM